LTYKAINEGRLKKAIVDDKEAVWLDAARTFADLLVSGKVGWVVGPRASLEDIFMVKRLGALSEAPVWGLDWSAEGVQDDFLMRADLNPNRKAFELLGLNTDPAHFERKLPELALLVTVDVQLPEDLKPKALAQIASHQGAALGEPIEQRAKVVLPAAMHAERSGTYVQFEGRLQKVLPAFDPQGDALPAWEILAHLGRNLGYDLPIDFVQLWHAIGLELGQPDLTFEAIPAAGLDLSTSYRAEASLPGGRA
jgi:NADH-quinone oxidoreductase subunit G